MDENIVQLQVPMNHIDLVESGTSRNDLPNALLSNRFTEPFPLVEQLLQAPTIGILEYTVVILGSPDHFLLMHDVGTIDETQEYDLPAQR